MLKALQLLTFFGLFLLPNQQSIVVEHPKSFLLDEECVEEHGTSNLRMILILENFTTHHVLLFLRNQIHKIDDLAEYASIHYITTSWVKVIALQLFEHD